MHCREIFGICTVAVVKAQIRKVFSFAAIMVVLVSPGAAIAAEMKFGGAGYAYVALLRLSEAFNTANPGDKVEGIPSLGGNGGILAVTEGALHIAVTSRALRLDEKANGLVSTPWFDTPFLFVTSHPRPQKLTKTDVVAIHNGTLTAWPDGNKIRPILRPKSNNFTPFLIANFEGMQVALDKLRARPDVPVAATDQDNIHAAEQTPYSFAAATLVQLMTEKPALRPISLDGIEASVEAMRKGSYPLKLRLHVVMKSDSQPIVRRFATFLRSEYAEKFLRENGAALLPNEAGATQ
jgi:phosphate transport system substrate-binding protein